MIATVSVVYLLLATVAIIQSYYGGNVGIFGHHGSCFYLAAVLVIGTAVV
jgi:hypothetical protein